MYRPRYCINRFSPNSAYKSRTRTLNKRLFVSIGSHRIALTSTAPVLHTEGSGINRFSPNSAYKFDG